MVNAPYNKPRPKMAIKMHELTHFLKNAFITQTLPYKPRMGTRKENNKSAPSF
ncbi:hypothetical protein [Maribacter luteus]|uniref:hypothetical protein n=1 Tax=Maribacter luteus TaxID=2594478 RepID=UPI0024931F13|nr:hypothetical protein [Maribacter luteus]